MCLKVSFFFAVTYYLVLIIFLGYDDAKVDYVPIMVDPRTRKNIRPGERGMLAYLQYMIYEAKFLRRGDMLLFDGESSFKTPTVQECLLNHGIYMFVISPSALHQLLNPCDNNFHSLFKLKYYRILSQQNSTFFSPTEKFKMAKQSYDDIGVVVVARLFERCGLVGTGDKESIVYNLIFEGIATLNKYNGFHRNSLASYMHWCVDSGNSDLCSHLNPTILKLAGLVTEH